MPPKWSQERLLQYVGWAGKVLLVLSYMSWAVQLAGLIASQAACGKFADPEKVFGTGGEFSPARACDHFYMFPWFKTCYQLFLLSSTAACMITGTVKPFKNTLTLLRAIAIGMAIDSTNNFLGAYYASSGILKVHTTVIFVGAVTLVVWLFLTEIVQATDFELLWENLTDNSNHGMPRSYDGSRRGGSHYSNGRTSTEAWNGVRTVHAQ